MQSKYFGFRTDKGKKREGNEDALLLLPKFGIFAVADGVGGESYGEVASRKAIAGIEEFVFNNPLSGADNMETKQRKSWLKGYFHRCLQKVNAEIRTEAQTHPEMSRMATTLVLCFLDMDSVYVVNIGDSRAYLVREGAMRQLTEDNTYVNKLVSAGTLTRKEAREHPQKNIITKALGSKKNVDPDFYRFNLFKGDRILLCSDGLHGELTDEEIAAILTKKSDLNTICMELVNTANKNGGNDNITVICIDSM